MYGSELEDDEDQVEEELRAMEGEAPSGNEAPQKAPESTPNLKEQILEEKPHRDSSVSTKDSARSAGDEVEDLLPKAAHDATSK